MGARKKLGLVAAGALAVAPALSLVPIGSAGAATSPTTVAFAGTITSTMTVNNGIDAGTIPAGTPYTGQLVLDGGQAPTPVAYGGGTHSVYTFSSLAFTIGTSTATSGPGWIDVYDNLTTSTSYPAGDSVYVNFTKGVTNSTGVAPSGPLAGVTFNWMGLALLDPTGAAVTAGALPATLDGAAFGTRFSEFNYGTLGTAWGAGNTSTIQSLTSVTTTGTSTPPPATVCSGTNGVETAYVARNPGYVVVNGGTNLLDHLWTTNLNSVNTTFLGGLTNWYQTGLILSWTGTADPAGCILDHLTVAPPVTVSTTSLPNGTVGVAYQASVTASWGVAPYTLAVSGLPAGLSFDGTNITGTPTAAGTSTVTVTATDAVGASASASLSLTVDLGYPAGSYTMKDEGKGTITAIAPDRSYLMVGKKKLLIAPTTFVQENTPDGPVYALDGFTQVGMKVQWKGLRDKATGMVLTSRVEIG